MPATSPRECLQRRLLLDRRPERDVSRVPQQEEEEEEMSVFLTNAQIDDVRREIIVLREPKSQHPSAARAFDAERLLCSVVDCDAPHLPGTRWCEAHKPRFGEAA